MADTLAGFFAEEGEPAAGTATEAALAGTRWIDHFCGTRQHCARFVIGAAIASEITGIVIYDLVVGVRAGKLIIVPRHEFAVMLDRWSEAEFFPVDGNGAHAMWTDGDNLGHLRLLQGFEVLFSELLEHEVVAQAAGR